MIGKLDELLGGHLPWTSIPSRERSNTNWCLIHATEISFDKWLSKLKRITVKSLNEHQCVIAVPESLDWHMDTAACNSL